MQPLDRATFDRLAAAYFQAWKLSLLAAHADGSLAFGHLPASGQTAVEFQESFRFAIEESLRWGDPAIEVGPQRTFVWAVPLMTNALLTGGLVAAIAERRLFPGGRPTPILDVQKASLQLRRLAEEHNLTNAALLAARRAEYQREQKRAEAIHAFKSDSGYHLRSLFLLDEPALIAAIRQANRAEARSQLNRILVRIIHHTGNRLALAKSFFLELVVTLCRTAVEAGGAPEELLGVNYTSMTELAAIKNDEALAAWLHDMLERIMDSIARTNPQDPPTVATRALEYIHEHASEDVSRDQAAHALGVSPAHFSRLLHAHLGKTFTDLLNESRIRRATELLARTSKPLKLVALEAGFQDQSYFTKVFRKQTRLTPRQYRLNRTRAE